MTRVLITGGAGFIGSHVADDLLDHGYAVRVLDCLTPQVHGDAGDGSSPRPAYLHGDVELLIGDVRDLDAVRHALAGVDLVCHLAAAVGVGQSMYQVAHYAHTNAVGTAVLLEALTRRPVRRLVVASSMSVYGEGLYARGDGGLVDDAERGAESLRRGDWEPRDREGRPLRPLPTPESKRPSLQSVYALSKFDQERLCLLIGRAYGISTVALRFFNTYGPRQALSNPYTGVLAIFAARLLAGDPPLIYEDGLQRRDFVSVRDVARACRLALESQNLSPEPMDAVFNIGSGERHTVLDVTQRLAAALGSPVIPRVEGTYRAGDIRHCYADITRARERLAYHPEVSLAEGMAELVAWLAEHGDREAHGGLENAQAELATRGLVIAARQGKASRPLVTP
ncbi:MAG TPA: NAD-dependent epimerase/dehydratase family protein [Chloroflexota bacterium]|nr:NAD-dependent epimerase/dehydratase family protein [Chloroflexota bacterium]